MTALLSLTAGLASCFCVLVLLYNMVAAVLFMGEESQGRSSGLAKASWALGLVALLSWWLPCVGALLGAAAIGLARIERGRIYRDEASLAGATPVRLGGLNGGMSILLQILWTIGLAGGALSSL